MPRPTAVTVPIPGPLTEGRFRLRPNRFVVHAELADGSLAVAHLADPGRLEELLVPDRRLWLRRACGAKRRTRWSVVLVQDPRGLGLVSVDTTLPNRLIARALERGVLDEFEGFCLERAEFPLGGSRFDFLLRREGRAAVRGRTSKRQASRLLLEVKSVTLVEDGVGLFPDAVTARGTRHVRELTEQVAEGDFQAAILFVVQRQDARRVLAAPAIDPDFAQALARARAGGVKVLARRCRVNLRGVTLGEALPAE